MADTPLSFDTEHVYVENYDVVCYRAGAGEETILCLNGGPGLPCNYLREPHGFLADQGFQVVTFDQLGCGASSHPDCPGLWTIGRYVEEVERVRQQLELGDVHLLGHSWGGWLSIEYMLKYGDRVKSLVLADTCANIPHLVSELMQLRSALGVETQAMMRAHEADETIDHPEYAAAITLLGYRHVCRLSERPDPLQYSLNNSNRVIYKTMQGPNEFLYTGNLRNWDRWDDLGSIRCPVLIVVGRHDEITPACALEMHHRLADSRVVVFPNSSHMPFYEEPEMYRDQLLTFLR
jgi:proline iminopeptidase